MNRIQINRVKKEYKNDAHRAVAPEKTLDLIKPSVQKAGVKDLLCLTEADGINIPVYSAVRPRAVWGGTRFCTGKGVSTNEAKASAMMEAVERFSAEYRGEEMKFASYEQIGLTKALDPKDLILPRDVQTGEEMHWVFAWDILGDDDMYIPANAVFHPYDPLGMAQQLFRSNTNGLAAGNTPEEAVLYGIYEVIENDALSCAQNGRFLGKKLIIDTQGPLKNLCKRYEENGIRINMWYIEGKTKVPTIAASSDDTVTKEPGLLVTGMGSNLNPEIAAIHALTEIAQRRADDIKGYRENRTRKSIVEKAGYDRLKRINRIWFPETDTKEEIKISEIPDSSTDYIDEDIKIILDRISGLSEHVFIYFLSKTEIPVARVVIPGFEVSCIDPTRKKML
ncbi:ribosomal protein S12 methylthiotransferase accessory factor [Methanomicrobium sp. W14]|uniref:YcaO-related McrA-glycine thioamidation protein n=1 Tax=Methanomicrobium sp. W14 TaxID=2817839 RepID=UPI001AE36A00|nr:YcaO-related McrA-glycine thioamidation protein [Methanomicrobium sp. W14]MBP2133368.1 ribosomal protein S12 methylthiotransferase accessory factor [Methanomicrobium sp. W14]